MIASFLALTLLTQTSPYPGVVELQGVTVRGFPMDYRLQVDVAGANEASTMVVSADPAMNCGASQFDRLPGPFRKCWLRGRRGDPILLTAEHAGTFGRDWTVDWTGCAPQGDGRRCAAEIAGEMQVEATFRAL